MTIMNYCAKSDPQATRLVYILTTFNHVIVSRAPSTSSLRDPVPAHTPVPNTPTGAMSNSSNDPIANFFLAHSNPTVPAGCFGQSASQQQSSHAAPDLVRRDSTNVPPGPEPSPGMIPTTEATPTASASGDIMSEAEWFHFDSLWENWAPPGTAVSGGAAAAAAAAVTDPALYNDSALNNYEVQTNAFAAPPVPGASQAEMRYTGAGGGMQVPLYPMIRFTE